jgi:NAD(P)-dependent dehydrogenase (short-subunit alcohol dehydrogenase family)
MSNLAGKSAVVAAGAKNLGGLISTTLGERGVNVAVHYNSAATEADADKTVAQIQESGTKAIKVQGDLTVPANVEALFGAAVDAFGGVDISANRLWKPLRPNTTRCSTSIPRQRTSSCSRRAGGLTTAAR